GEETRQGDRLGERVQQIDGLGDAPWGGRHPLGGDTPGGWWTGRLRSWIATSQGAKRAASCCPEETAPACAFFAAESPKKTAVAHEIRRRSSRRFAEARFATEGAEIEGAEEGVWVLGRMGSWPLIALS